MQDGLADFELFERVHPLPMVDDVNTRSWAELTVGERDWLKAEFFSLLGIAQNDVLLEIRSYEYQIPTSDPNAVPSMAKVCVYQTPRSKEEGMYLHKTIFPDDSEEFFVARKNASL